MGVKAVHNLEGALPKDKAPRWGLHGGEASGTRHSPTHHPGEAISPGGAEQAA